MKTISFFTLSFVLISCSSFSNKNAHFQQDTSERLPTSVIDRESAKLILIPQKDSQPPIVLTSGKKFSLDKDAILLEWKDSTLVRALIVNEKSDKELRSFYFNSKMMPMLNLAGKLSDAEGSEEDYLYSNIDHKSSEIKNLQLEKAQDETYPQASLSFESSSGSATVAWVHVEYTLNNLDNKELAENVTNKLFITNSRAKMGIQSPRVRKHTLQITPFNISKMIIENDGHKILDSESNYNFTNKTWSNPQRASIRLQLEAGNWSW